MFRTRLLPTILSLTYATVAASFASGPEKTVQWPQFRGPNASGVAHGFATPTTWNAVGDRKVKWKTPIPGLGHSSPIVWGDRVYVTTAVSGKDDADLRVGLYGDIAPVEDDTVHQWIVFCLDKSTGDVVWKQTAHKGVPAVKRHTKATHANSTPATDGKHVVAFFGSEGLYCYDTQGKHLWSKNFGVLDSGYYVVPPAQWEFGSSPVIYKDMVIVQCDVQKNSFIAALNIDTGEETWRTPRDEVPTWSTPTIYENNGHLQIIANGFKHIGGYDLNTGKEIWKMHGGGDIPVPTPVAADGLFFITNAHGGMAPMYAIHSTVRGDISLGENELTSDNFAWLDKRRGDYMQTPIVYGDYLYGCNDAGILTCFEAKTGSRAYRTRLGDGSTGFTASPVAADEKLYFTSEEGDVFVMKAGPEKELLATNSMGEICMATPAISEGILFFRTYRHVVAIAEGNKPPPPSK